MVRSTFRQRFLLFLLSAAILLLAACGESDRDETAPALTLSTDLQTLSPRQTATVALAGSIEEGATLEVLLNETEVSGATVVGDTWSVTIEGLVEGSNEVALTASDSAGNTNTIRLSIVLDTTAPTVASPFAGAAVVTSPLPIALFSEAMSGASVEANVTLTRADGGEAPVGEIVYLAGDRTAYFLAADTFTFAPAATYTVHLAAGIVDLVGNPLPAQSFSFTTAAP